MSEVKRYTKKRTRAQIELAKPGTEFVLASDYDTLAAECERLREQHEGAESQAEYQRDRAEHFQAERDAALAELAEEQALRERMAELLRQSAVALRGPEPPLTRYSYADIPSRIKAVVEELAALKGGAGPLRADQMQVHGYYWWLPACFEDKPDDPRNWSVYNWHPSHPVKSGLFVGPILSPADAAPPAQPAQASAWVALDEYERQTKALPCQHEIPERGCSTYNWRMSVIRDLRAMLAAAPTPGASDGKGGE